jgi:hypothetical protein
MNLLYSTYETAHKLFIEFGTVQWELAECFSKNIATVLRSAC